MRISRSAPNLLKKAVTSFKSKTDAVRAKLMILASLRRRMAMVCAMSRQIQALVASDGRGKQQARVEYHSKALITVQKHKAAMDMETSSKEPAAGDVGGKVRAGLFDEVAVLEEGLHGYPDWTSSLFDDENCCGDEDDDDDVQDDLLDLLDDEPSVIEIIRCNRMAEGLEFNMDDEIDEACDMFIRRCRGRMNLSF